MFSSASSSLAKSISSHYFEQLELPDASRTAIRSNSGLPVRRCRAAKQAHELRDLFLEYGR